MNLRLDHEKSTRTEDHEARWNAAFESLENLRALQDDWDGNGAPAPSSELIDAVKRKIGELREDDYPPPTSVAPSFDGTICVDWERSNGYWELEFLSPTEMEEIDGRRGVGETTITQHVI